MESVMKMFSLDGQTAVITGGTRGIGAAMALALAEAGADTILIQVRQFPIPPLPNIRLLMAEPRREINPTPTPSTKSTNLAEKPASYLPISKIKAPSAK